MPPQAQPKRTTCKRCGQDWGDPGRLGRKGTCIDCSIRNAADNMHQMAAGEGPAYEKYREALVRAVTTGDTRRKRGAQRRAAAAQRAAEREKRQSTQ